MNWLIDDIRFSDYGVVVESSSGALDMPRLDIDSHDWGDSNGLEVRETVRKQKSEITLQCWIKGTSFPDFKTKVSAFWNALASPGYRVLKSDYIPNGVNVYLEKSINLSRRTGWNREKQIGRFTLRLSVPGEENAYELAIKRWDPTTGMSIVANVLTTDLKIIKTLQGESYATCTFESPQKLGLKYHDNIDILSNGNNSESFYLLTDPHYRKKSNNRYQYSLRFDHQMAWLESSQFLNIAEEGDFFYHANMDEIVDLIVTNHNRRWWGNFQKGTVVATERKLHKFNAEDCLSVLRRMCSEKEYDLEFEFELVSASKYRINVQEKVANDIPVTLEYGEGKGLYELSREKLDKKDICTILYAYGSTKNLKPEYRNGLKRLSFTGNPLINNDGLHDGAGPHERTIFFEEIFPRRVAPVTSYVQILEDELTDKQKNTYPQGLFMLTDTALDFDLNNYMLGGLTPKVKTKTGDLAGYDFEIHRYDHPSKTMYLIPYKDERGEIFPNATLMIKAGDEYTLIDIDQPDSYVQAAEQEVKDAGIEYLAAHSIPSFPYRATVDPEFLKVNGIGGFEVGDRVGVIDTDFGINNPLRISNLIYSVLDGSYEFVLSDRAVIQRRKEIEMRLKAIEDRQKSSGMDETENNRRDVETTKELRNRVFDPVDDKINVDRNIRNESIDPRMLSYDAGVPQISLKNALVKPNFGGDEDAFKVFPGTLIMHNYYRRPRWEIEKLKDEGIYNPTREWDILETLFNFPTKNGYFLYAKINLLEGSRECVLEVFEEHIEVKNLIESGYLRFKLGHISDASSPRTAAMLFGNVKYDAYASFEALDASGDVGTGADQLAKGDHDHTIDAVKYSVQTVRYGFLYNFPTVLDARGILADGYHIPDLTELTTLRNYLGGATVAGLKMKAVGFGGDNSSGLNMLGSGQRLGDGSFAGRLDMAYYWLSNTDANRIFTLIRTADFCGGSNTAANYGHSIRGIKDSLTAEELALPDFTEASPYIGNDGRSYKTIKIGTQIWIGESLAETEFRDGSPIPEVTDNAEWGATLSAARCSYSNDENYAFTTTYSSYSEHKHDEHYYTETETDTLLSGKSDTGHNHDADYDPNGAAASHVSTHENAYDHSKLHDHANKADLDNYDPANFVSANDSRLTDAREWTASEVTQAEAEAGTETTPRKWTAQRVKQAIEALAGGRNIDGGSADEIYLTEQLIDGGGA